ncbi:MAG TPA: DNA polymerase IV, partial [Acidimicrobiia bacterium]|nr:DNA polymerase IV [Acidimicrobiia bacterium]
LDDSPGEVVTLIGISVSNLTTDDHVQLELDLGDGDLLRAGSDLALRRSKLEGKVDEVRERFGRDLLRYGTGAGGASDEFRRLAEKS